jgi:hypothetical protein
MPGRVRNVFVRRTFSRTARLPQTLGEESGQSDSEGQRQKERELGVEIHHPFNQLGEHRNLLVYRAATPLCLRTGRTTRWSDLTSSRWRRNQVPPYGAPLLFDGGVG